MINIAINGFGRIGRCFLRAFYEKKIYEKINLVQINGVSGGEKCAHFAKYDSVHGIFKNEISYGEDWIDVGFGKVKVTNQRDLDSIKWDNIDVVIESSGKFNKKSLLMNHIQAGAKKILVSAPCDDADSTIIYGVNDFQFDKNHQIVSVGSCTTNALLPLIKLIHENFKIKNGFFTTIHSYTNDQVILDASHKDLRRARAGAMSMIPTSTGASKLIASIFPELNKKISGTAVRVPTPNVSMIDFVVNLEKKISSEELWEVLKNGAKDFPNIIEYTDKPLVSVDFTHNSHSTIIDGLESSIIDGDLCRVASWYDNEWGFTCRMIDILENFLMKFFQR
jgi:glyceraldehyde 3-phosphate dehydrogenase